MALQLVEDTNHAYFTTVRSAHIIILQILPHDEMAMYLQLQLIYIILATTKLPNTTDH